MNRKITKFVGKKRLTTYKLKNTSISGRSDSRDQLKRDNYGKKANFYEVLSLDSKNAGFSDIKKADRNMALQYHPDVYLDSSAKEESTRRFIELQKAYETLSNPVSRKMYDYDLGLVDYNSVEFGMEGRRTMFSKEVWENQLLGLKRRSQLRRKRRTYN